MTASEIRDKVMSMESEDVRNELAQLCDIVSRMEELAKEPSDSCKADGTYYDSH